MRIIKDISSFAWDTKSSQRVGNILVDHSILPPIVWNHPATSAPAMPHSCWKSMGIYIYIYGPWQYIKVLSPLLQYFIVRHLFCPILVNLLSQECWFPQLPKVSMAHLCWSPSAVSCRCVQIAFQNPNRNHTIQYPICNYWKYFSAPRPWASSGANVENFWSVKRCHLKRHTPCLWERQS